MDIGTLVILENDENVNDFPECLTALLVVKMDGTVVKDRMGILIHSANVQGDASAEPTPVQQESFPPSHPPACVCPAWARCKWGASPL